jgi:hypothetical protein
MAKTFTISVAVTADELQSLLGHSHGVASHFDVI